MHNSPSNHPPGSAPEVNPIVRLIGDTIEKLLYMLRDGVRWWWGHTRGATTTKGKLGWFFGGIIGLCTLCSMVTMPFAGPPVTEGDSAGAALPIAAKADDSGESGSGQGQAGQEESEPTPLNGAAADEPAPATSTVLPPTITVEPPTSTPVPPTATPEPPTATPVPPPPNTAYSGPYPLVTNATTLEKGRVLTVVDGDTLSVQLFGGGIERVRLIGMDTPETVDPREPVQCFGKEASAQAVAMLAGETISLERDPSQDDRDRYDRLLRYVWLPDGRLFNLEMIVLGYAHEYTYEVPYRYQAEFQAAEAQAQVASAGLWSPTTCNGDTTRAAASPTPIPRPTTPPVQAAPPPPAPAGNCDPSYPTVCIPPKSQVGDLDCGDIPQFGYFEVLPPDPHGFDGNDNDGWGCEGN